VLSSATHKITTTMNKALDILTAFSHITLAEMDAVALLDRTDTKFMFHYNALPEVLNLISHQYKVLKINGSVFSRYETHYLDTDTFEMYTMHHNGRLNRNKVRFRNYVDSRISFFEIKHKTNKGRTIKHRIKIRDNSADITSEVEELLRHNTIYEPADIHEVIQVNYKRITLVGTHLPERVTLDFGLNYQIGQQTFELPSIVIAEVKQDRNQHSPFITIMQNHHQHPFSMSKYCLGIASMVDHVKSNRFKSKIVAINKLSHANN
jgi:hypothetical protein